MGEGKQRTVQRHVHQKHNNVSIKIELAPIEAPRWKTYLEGSRMKNVKTYLNRTYQSVGAVSEMKFPPDTFGTAEDYPIKE